MTFSNASTRSIGLLGGSFNPPHGGHRDISLAALERLNLEAVWWLVTPGNPLKDPELYAPYEERLHKARKVADHPNIIVSDFERRHGLQYSVDTIERLLFLNPGVRFVWIMGADSLTNFHKWKDWRRIAEQVPMAVFNRPGHNDAALKSEAAQALSAFLLTDDSTTKLTQSEPPAWAYFADTNNPTSSTAIRKAAQTSPEKPQT